MAVKDIWVTVEVFNIIGEVRKSYIERMFEKVVLEYSSKPAFIFYQYQYVIQNLQVVYNCEYVSA